MANEEHVIKYFSEQVLSAQMTIKAAFRKACGIPGLNIATVISKIRKAIEEAEAEEDGGGYDDTRGVLIPGAPRPGQGSAKTYIVEVIEWIRNNCEFPAELDPDLKQMIILLLAFCVAGRHTVNEYLLWTRIQSVKEPDFSISGGILYSEALYNAFEDAILPELERLKPGQSTAPGAKEEEKTGLDYRPGK